MDAFEQKIHDSQVLARRCLQWAAANGALWIATLAPGRPLPTLAPFALGFVVANLMLALCLATIARRDRLRLAQRWTRIAQAHNLLAQDKATRESP